MLLARFPHSVRTNVHVGHATLWSWWWWRQSSWYWLHFWLFYLFIYSSFLPSFLPRIISFSWSPIPYSVVSIVSFNPVLILLCPSFIVSHRLMSPLFWPLQSLFLHLCWPILVTSKGSFSFPLLPFSYPLLLFILFLCWSPIPPQRSRLVIR